MAKLSISDVTKETRPVDTFRKNRLSEKNGSAEMPHGDEIFNNSEHHDDERRRGEITATKND